jgi:PAS domain S-box-containing protein
MDPSSPDYAVVAIDPQGLVTGWSGAAAAWIGHSASKVVGMNVEMIVPDEYRERHRDGLARAMAGGQRSADAAPFHLPVLRSDGVVETFAVRFVFLDTATGRPVGATVILERADPLAEPWTSVPSAPPDCLAAPVGGRVPVIDHVTLQVSDLARSEEFYAMVLGTLGITAERDDGAIGFIGDFGGFWIIPGEAGSVRETHIGFTARSRGDVEAFHQAAAKNGYEVLHPPRVFAEYGAHYYATFVRDPDGHNVEAVCRQPSDGRDD